MKKLITFLLLCSMLCSLFVFAAGAEEFDEMALMQYTLSFVNELSTPELKAIVMPEPPADENNVSLITAAPLAVKPCCQRGEMLPIRSLLLSTGAPEQYYCAAVYYTYYQFLEDEPLALFVAQFPEEAGLYATRFEWDTRKANPEIYSYDVVFFTATKRGNDLVPIDGTLSRQDLSVKDYSYPAESLYFYDIDMKNKIQKHCVAKDDINAAIATFGKYDYYTCTQELELRVVGDCVAVEDLSGLLCFYGLDYGWATLIVSIGNVKTSLPIEVCVGSDGHTDEQTVIVEATEETEGLIRHHCTVCGTTYDEVIRLTPLVQDVFADVEPDDWYCDAIQFVYDRGLFNGVSESMFAPDNILTRAQLVTVLHRYAGSPEIVKEDSGFTDVESQKWYGTPVIWASENGIVNGVGDGKFDPNGNITREQLATILYRYSILNGMDVTVEGDASAFVDAADVSNYAKDAVNWAVAKGLINGIKTEDGTILLSPGSYTTRAQVAAILLRYIHG